MKQRYQHHAPQHMPFTAAVRKDYGQPYPVQRRRQRRESVLSAATGFLAIAFFIAALLVTFHLIPNAIDAEIARQTAVVERSLGVSR